MQTVILIEDMACEHCAAKIDHALAETSIRYTVDLPRKAVIVMTSNRGLAGGYNANVVKLITQGNFDLKELDIYAVGKKGKDALQRAGCKISLDCSDICEEPTYADAAALGRRVLTSFAQGEVGEIWLAYTSFINTVVHEPRLIRLLPVSKEDVDEKVEREGSAGLKLQMNFEAEEESILCYSAISANMKSQEMPIRL